MNFENSKREFTIAHIRARRAIGTASKRRRVPRQAAPDAIRLEYYKAIRAFLARAHAAVTRELIPALPAIIRETIEARGDSTLWRADASRKVTDLIRKIAASVAGDVGDRELESLASKFGERTSEFQRAQLNRQVRAALGVDIFKADPALRPRIADFARENVSLIKSISSDYFAKVEQVTIRGARQGIRHEELVKQIEERFSVTESRAKLIARDQIGKLYGEINEARQQSLGIDGFTWRTSGDLRVRDEHAEREGESYGWEELPPDERPGQPINCRCYAEPDFSRLLASLK